MATRIATLGVVAVMVIAFSAPTSGPIGLDYETISENEKRLLVGGNCPNTKCQIECSPSQSACFGTCKENQGDGERCAGNSNGSGSGNVYTTIRSDGNKATLSDPETKCTPEWVCRCKKNIVSGFVECKKVDNPGEQSGKATCTTSSCSS